MRSNGAIVIEPTDNSPAGPIGYPAHGEPHHQVNIVHVVHGLLRGRYAITITLALILGIGAAAAGYLLPTPRYKAEGLIRIQPVLPRILYESEQNTLPPMFSSFVNTQASLIQHSRVLNKAMDSDGWRALGRKRDPESERDFRESLRVNTNREAPELIAVSFTDDESRAAFVAVSEVISAYQDAFGGSETKAQRETQNKILTQRKQALESQKRDLENRISNESAEFETDDLVRLGDHYLTQLLALDDRLAEVSLALAEAGIDPKALPIEPAANDDPAAPAEIEQSLTPEQIAAFDPTMSSYLIERGELRRRIDLYKERGIGPRHVGMIDLQAELTSLERAIESRANTLNDAASDQTNPAVPPNIGIAAGTMPTPAQLVKRYQHLRQTSEALRTRTDRVSKRRQQIDALRRELKIADTNLDEVTRRLDEIAVESKMTDRIGRIEAILPDSPPSTPTVDPRKKYAMMGLVLGGGFPVGIFLLIGLIDRRFRYSDQAGDRLGGARMLGILPELPTTSDDPEQTAAAVHCVHHIRSMLQLADPTRKVYVVTSPTAGDGKTSLSLSLAMSFTAAGARTLLVDFDLIGHGLTSRLGLSRDRGIGHALASGETNSSAEPTSVPGLSLIPSGREDVTCASRVSRATLDSLLTRLRSEFDIIIVDTGPILGSLEANLAASVADAVVMVVGRGQHSSDAQSAIRHLAQLGAHLAGIVFNRAHSMDFSRSRSASTSFRSVRATAAASNGRPSTDLVSTDQALGPLARSVAVDIRP